MTDDEVLRHFDAIPEFGEMSRHWHPNLKQLFCRLVRAIHSTGLDLYNVDIRNQIRFGLKNIDDRTAYSVAGYIKLANDVVEVTSNNTWAGDRIESIDWRRWRNLDTGLVREMVSELENWNGIPESLQRNRAGLWPDEYSGHTPVAGQENGLGSVETSPGRSLNTILYGPPGTGKTYATIQQCVEICDGAASAEAKSEKEINDRYHELVEEGRVEFVTFHQSYGYEEFIEGLRPQTGSTDTDSDGGAGFRLDPEDGVLKRIAERARMVRAPAATSFHLGDRNVFKMGLGNPIEADEQGIFEECIGNGYALLDWGGNVDWSGTAFSRHEEILTRWQGEENDATGHSANVKFIHCFRNQLRKNDLIVVPTSRQRFRAVGEITGPYEFTERPDGIYPHRRNVNWLWVERTGMPFSEIYDSRIGPQTIYQMRSDGLRKDRLTGYIGQAEESPNPLPYVLVIDEINRGNISKVFGEAITLVEEDKRSGKLHEIHVTLPYSGKRFILPDNLHILGTMNTADRSIALLDTALRRRFDFEELIPEPELLKEAAERSGIDLPAVLTTLNNRLEWLLGRDHLIGHAWLMNARSNDDVDSIMRRKIIPMLAEYFHQDWSRVRAVLGGGFIERKTLGVPPELDDADIGEDRYRWTVRDVFPKVAYDRLISGEDRQTNSIDDDTEVDND